MILSILLSTEQTHADVDLDVIAQHSAMYSGSDLKELCKYAATLPLREYVRSRSSPRSETLSAKSDNFNENVIMDGMSTPDGTSSKQSRWFLFNGNNNNKTTSTP